MLQLKNCKVSEVDVISFFKIPLLSLPWPYAATAFWLPNVILVTTLGATPQSFRHSHPPLCHPTPGYVLQKHPMKVIRTIKLSMCISVFFTDVFEWTIKNLFKSWQKNPKNYPVVDGSEIPRPTTWNVLKLKVDYPYQLVFTSDFWSINSLSFVRNPNSKGLMRFHESQELGKQIGWDLPQEKTPLSFQNHARYDLCKHMYVYVMMICIYIIHIGCWLITDNILETYVI